MLGSTRGPLPPSPHHGAATVSWDGAETGRRGLRAALKYYSKGEASQGAARTFRAFRSHSPWGPVPQGTGPFRLPCQHPLLFIVYKSSVGTCGVGRCGTQAPPHGGGGGERGWGEEGGPLGEFWGPCKGGTAPLPNSACCTLRPWTAGQRPEPLRLSVVWEGQPPVYQGPGVLEPPLLLPPLSAPNSLGQVCSSTSDPTEEGPQRMRGAERSLVTVGRSFTVAKGFVPL